MNLKAVLLLSLLFVVPVNGQQPTPPAYTHVTITMKAEGGPCGCTNCCSAYSVSVDENGTVIYNGVEAVKVHGEKIHSIPVNTVRELVAEFYRADFFSLQDRYEYKTLPNGNTESIDHANATTISIDIDGKKKSVYIFYGAPKELIDLQQKLVELTQIGQYIGAGQTW
jgi:hypothetical protein